MKYQILILTDNNRNALNISMMEGDELPTGSLPVSGTHRLIYQEIHESREQAMSRLRELQSYTRMQKERIIRRSNPNWINLLLRPSLRNDYQPGVKFRPNVPNSMSLR